MEKVLYTDSCLSLDRKFALEYSGAEDDLLLLETEHHIVFLTLIDNTVIINGPVKYTKFDEFPDELKEAIRTHGIQDAYGKFRVLERCAFSYCISRKLEEDEEEFICCSPGFDEIGSEEEELEKMLSFLQQQI